MFLSLPVSEAATNAATYSCPCRLWGDAAAPAIAAENDPNAVEIGVKFTSSVNGYLTGIRFYKGSGNTGTHVAHLWTRTGTRLASATFAGETASGWQQVSFAAPVAISANTTYVASYYAPNGHYAVNEGFFATATTNGPLTAPASASSGGNGVYKYGASGFPNLTYQQSNYWVDVVFELPSPGTTDPTPTATPTAVPPTDTPAATPTAAPTATATWTPTPTWTPAATAPTDTPTLTPIPAVPTATPTPTPAGPLSAGFTSPGALTLRATYQSIGVYANFSGDGDADNRATLEYRRAGESAWRRGMDMTPDRRATVFGADASYPNPFKNQWRAAVLLTQAGAEYEVRVTFSDPDGVAGTNPVVGLVRTRSDDTPAAGTTYYVAPTGADTAPGSAAAPWRTLQHAAGAVNPGDTVLVRAGAYAPVSLARSGAPGDWVLFKAFPGERPLISAAAGSGTLVSITGSYVRFGGFELAGGQWGVVVGGAAHDVVVERNLIRGQKAVSQMGVPVQIGTTFSTQSAVADVTVQDNDVRADTLPEPETDAILVQAAAGGHVIRRNRVVFSYPGGAVHGTDCVGGLPNFAPHGGYFADTDVSDNDCQGATDEGIELDGGNANVRVWGNTVVRANLGFSTTPVYYGPVYVFRNVVHRLQDHWVGSCVAVKDGEGGTGAVFFYHNTVYAPSGAGCNNIVKGFAKYGGGEEQANVVVKNNILHLWGRLYETGGKTADRNLAFVEPASGDKVAEFDGADYWSFDDFRTGTGQERNGLWGRAAFVDAAGGDFRLAAGSPGVDAGAVLPGFDDADSPWPYRGAAPDVGAFES